MGDYDAAGSEKWEQLQRAYSKYWKYVGCVQLPHHGSKYNFNDNFVDLDAFFVISAGFSNRFHHPHASVVKALLLSHKTLFVVTEQAGSSVHLQIE